jgi:glycine cleavage system aminomethyltransferase T/glycine/D-amino acid oxidase-like deaminating enzyme
VTAVLPDRARVVVVGGGVVGLSLAYHLTKLGQRDVVLLERAELTSGTTWHAAGLVGQMRASRAMTELCRYSADLYASLEAETGRPTGWRRNGTVAVARTEARFLQFRRAVSVAKGFGVEAQLIDARTAARLWPLMRADDLKGGVYVPGDGRVRPGDVALALAEGARRGGARVVEGVGATGFRSRHGAVTAVSTAHGDIDCEVAVNCGGMWARGVGLLCGVDVPLHAAEHMYMAAGPVEGARPDLPTLRDYDGHIYAREEAGGLVVGGFEPRARPWGMDGIPEDFAFRLLHEDWGQFAALMESGLFRIPALASAPERRLVVGPESFTPDGNFILGRPPGWRNLYVAAGFNSMGIAAAGGAGRALAQWILEGRPPTDLWEVDPRRFGPFHNTAAFLRDRTVEAVGLHYALRWPYSEPATGRGLRRSPLHDRLALAGACFGEAMGWERPQWFAPPGVEPRDAPSFGPQSWWPHSAEEHRAAREAVAVFDQSSLSKFLLEGDDGEAALQRLCAGDVAVPPGRVVRTAILNERGGIETDLIVARLARDRYLLVSGAAQQVRDFDLLRRGLPEGRRVALADVTAARAVLGVMGPRARDLLARLTRADLSVAAFPYGAVRQIDLGYAPVWALRVSYVGELGFELHAPVESAAGLYDAIMAAGADLGARDAGYRAMNSLRLEKGYPAWGRDIGPGDTPLEAGLAGWVAFDKPGGFAGREALLEQRASGPTRRLVLLTLAEPDALLLKDEPVYRDGRLVGWTTSGGLGHTIGRPVAMGYVRSPEGVGDAALLAGRYEIEVAGDRLAAELHLRPPYDPAGERVRA